MRVIKLDRKSKHLTLRTLIASALFSGCAVTSKEPQVAPQGQEEQLALEGTSDLAPGADGEDVASLMEDSANNSQGNDESEELVSSPILDEGLKAAAAGDLEAAVAAFRAAMADDRVRPVAQYNLGNVYLAQGNLKAASIAFKQAAGAKKEFMGAAVSLASMDERRGKKGAAEAALRELAQSYPNALEPKSVLAQLLARSGRLGEAYRLGLEVLAMDERNANAILALGMVYRRQKKFELAEMALRQATEIDSRLGTAYNELGIALNTQSKKTQAVKAFELAAQANPGSAAIANNLGVLRTEVGAYRAAIVNLERACAIEPSRADYAVNLGNAYRGEQRYEDAERSYLRSLELAENFSAGLFNLGVLYLDNELPGKEAPLVRYQLTIDYLSRFKDLGGVSPEDAQALGQYIAVATKLIKREKKRIERKRKRAQRKREKAGASGKPNRE